MIADMRAFQFIPQGLPRAKEVRGPYPALGLLPSVVALLGLATSAACGSDPADVAGTYTVAVTNRTNGCNLNNWTEGSSQSGIPLLITQADEDITATVEQAWGLAVAVWLGSRSFVGTVDGHDIEATLHGTNTFNMNGCTYTLNAELIGEHSGDALSGRLNYRGLGNGTDACATITDCVSFQEFAGVRPP